MYGSESAIFCKIINKGFHGVYSINAWNISYIMSFGVLSTASCDKFLLASQLSPSIDFIGQLFIPIPLFYFLLWRPNTHSIKNRTELPTLITKSWQDLFYCLRVWRAFTHFGTHFVCNGVILYFFFTTLSMDINWCLKNRLSSKENDLRLRYTLV